MILFNCLEKMELKFKHNGKEAILIVNNEEFVVSEEIMSLAFRYFHEKIEWWYFFWTIKDRYKSYINGEKYIKEYLLKYVPKNHTCPHCGSKNVNYYHIDRCADLPL